MSVRSDEAIAEIARLAVRDEDSRVEWAEIAKLEAEGRAKRALAEAAPEMLRLLLAAPIGETSRVLDGWYEARARVIQKLHAAGAVP